MDVLKKYPNNHFDSCVCDPPYELGFMGKKWDSTGIAYSVEMWREVWRVLKPGAHLIAFGGSRTYHRLACAIEDAGFIIRDQIMWLYGSGFPKSLDVSKAIDKAAGAEREVVGKYELPDVGDGRRGKGWECTNTTAPGIFGVSGQCDITAPASPLAQQWKGWGTGLKPAHEPIMVARKPLEGTVINNVLKWGCGAINIHGCMIDTGVPWERKGLADDLRGGGFKENRGKRIDLGPRTSNTNGRWPANVIHDGSDEVLAEFAKQSRESKMHWPGNRKAAVHSSAPGIVGFAGRRSGIPYNPVCLFEDKTQEATASRFFYCAKASPGERGRDNHHPTVKPLALMCYLVRLVTPPGGVVLDPFMGSGSTLIAAAKEGFDSVGIDKEATYVQISRKRIAGELGMLAEIEIDTIGEAPTT